MLQESKRVTVGVRIRPKLDGTVNALQAAERYAQVACSQYSDTTLRLWDGRLTAESRSFFFAFDGVFDETASQEELYEELAITAVNNVLSGTNSSIITYGQTGSGKTYTVLGGVRKNPISDDIITGDTGILLRSIQEILHYGEVHKNHLHLVIGLSAVEIYLDEVRDLLRGDQITPAVLQISVMKDLVRFPNLTCVPIKTLSDALRVYQKATARRAQRMTSANDTSSRSHAVFNIEIFQQPVTPGGSKPMTLYEYLSMKESAQIAQLEGKIPRQRSHALFENPSNLLLGMADAPVMYSKLSLADLAGSEKVRNTNVRAEGFDELKKINASLTSLGNVVRSLYEGSSHIPYRDSKLTTVLRDSFAAPNARVVLIVNVSPTVLTVNETLSSLYFADKVKMLRAGPNTGSNGNNSGDSNLIYDYLSSLRIYDELMADVRIAGVLHKFRAPQVIPLVADDHSNVLYDLNFRVRKPDSEVRRMAVATMCDAFRAIADENNEDVVHQQREIMETTQTLRDEMVSKWKERRNQLYEIIRSISNEASYQENNNEQIWNKKIEEASAHLGNTRSIRREIQQQRNSTSTSISEAENILNALDQEIKYLEQNAFKEYGLNDSTTVSFCELQDKYWNELSSQASKAIESANMRFNLCNLICETQQLSAELAEQKQKHNIPDNIQTVYEWLRKAVWGMSGSAVVISIRREKRRHQEELEIITGNPALNDYAVPRPRQYWQDRTSESSNGVVNGIVSNEEKGRKRRPGTRYDDVGLLEDVSSFMKMGGEMVKYTKDGSPHRRLFYIDKKSGDGRLCWSAVGSLGRDGYIPVSAITRLLLGRGDACKDINTYYLSWRVVYQQHNSQKTLELTCDSVLELEAWVIGLSHMTGVRPIFEEAMKMQPEEQAVWDGLSSGEVTFCAEWHVPPSVYAEARHQISRRRRGGRHSGLRLSPGELRNLVKLDIFRASAMWLRFFAEGLVVNPRRKLFCYVETPAIAETISVASATAIGAESSDNCSLKSLHS